MAKKLSKRRTELLEKLVRAGGSVQGNRLSVLDRRLASRMQADKLVKWDPRGKGDLDQWCLFITQIGTDAFSSIRKN